MLENIESGSKQFTMLECNDKQIYPIGLIFQICSITLEPSLRNIARIILIIWLYYLEIVLIVDLSIVDFSHRETSSSKEFAIET